MPLFKLAGGDCWQLEKEKRLGYIWRGVQDEYHAFLLSELEGDVVIAAPDRESLTTLNKYKTVLTNVLAESISSGWLSPKGEYYGCHSHTHLNLIEYALGLKESSAESAGWIKILNNGWITRGREKITPDQKRVLEKIGRSYVDPMFRDDNVTYEEAFPRGNKVMIELIQKFERLVSEEEKKFKKVFPTAETLSLYP